MQHQDRKYFETYIKYYRRIGDVCQYFISLTNASTITYNLTLSYRTTQQHCGGKIIRSTCLTDFTTMEHKKLTYFVPSSHFLADQCKEDAPKRNIGQL